MALEEFPPIPETPRTAAKNRMKAAMDALRLDYAACVDFSNRPLRVESMRDQLAFAESELPGLLRQRERWHGIKITEEGGLLRLSTSYGNVRICLHKIPPCAPGKSTYHYHQWPCIIRILEGDYEMGVGSGPAVRDEPPPIVCRLESGAGLVYEMPHREGWHYVRPRDARPTWSLMLMGDAWRQRAVAADHLGYEPLLDEEAEEVFEKFKTFYPAPAS